MPSSTVSSQRRGTMRSVDIFWTVAQQEMRKDGEDWYRIYIHIYDIYVLYTNVPVYVCVKIHSSLDQYVHTP